MGNIDPCCNTRQIPPDQTPPTPDLTLRYDEENYMMLSSYSISRLAPQGHVFEKKLYNWHGIPITNEILPEMATFSVKNRGIKDNNFVIGIIKKRAILENIRLPWKSGNCICLQSHQNEGGSGIIYKGKSQPALRGVRENQVLRVVATRDSIWFRVNNQTLGKMAIPEDFIVNQSVLPYVALFNEGDCIEFVDGIERETNKSRRLTIDTSYLN